MLKKITLLIIVGTIISCTPDIESYNSEESNIERRHSEKSNIHFPVEPTIFVSGKFSRCEGIAFNGLNDLYVSGNRALWRVDTFGRLTWITDGYSNLGLAPIGFQDILYADFGPTNAWSHGTNDDGIIWRVKPNGIIRDSVGGMGDPNFVLVLQDGAYLVSDDATNNIFIVSSEGNVSIYTNEINHPNGMALSIDGSKLYVAQMFKSINPDVTDGRIWSIPIYKNEIQGAPTVIVDLGDDAANDGLAVDEIGRIYIAAWGLGEIWRLNPQTLELTQIAMNLPGVASLAFGRGNFDQTALYATSTITGNVWKIKVGIRGASLNRGIYQIGSRKRN